jgi:hypothetical protein
VTLLNKKKVRTMTWDVYPGGKPPVVGAMIDNGDWPTEDVAKERKARLYK